uniref:Uncharacterized protein n=1 Tax=Phaeomonas parva TaxID=124430 RepID=A0A7S1XLS6_9STRA|mmetsp:Transcript_14723/g.44275  ORF Transcript_14723/g.44275 Transcript_14723/m.44275 type:complete len:840 (+) Transcript_14723:158-2677(+)|eukprot:CAMPEP_0118878248 /NCGR_PEP_ID=MMETSP1163-20130328/18229_1 /TAXON_ID=124430 /ORGANISM="Phaeomonas parva, Strain CCMP2877" /LENGTH=839 /DNA_ID=CAMNT_0006814055 /DNA_START=122 /DNA_END=2641 /DNA_ORIENTATION=+
MSVAGIDLGANSVLIATAARGGVDVVLNEASARQNAAMVSFQDGQRFICGAAESVARSNYYNTAKNLKHLIGRKFDEPDVALQQKFCGPELVRMDDGFVGMKVTIDGAETVLRPEQIVASLISHLYSMAAAANSGNAPRYCAIGIPSYYTDAQRRALMNACAIVDVQCLRLIHESTATALEYGIFRSARKEFPDDRDFKVLFLDMGASDFTASVVAFRNGELRVLSSASDRTLGGRLFDLAIAKKVCTEFKAKFKNLSGDPEQDAKTFYKVMGAAEKAKKTISPHGVEEAAIYIEFLQDDYDYSGKLTHEEFDQITADLVARIDAPIQQALSEAGIASATELDAVEMVGGATRVRSVKARFQSVLGEGVRITTTMNADESVTRGAALGCALLAPVFRSVPFDIKDIYPFPVQLQLDGGSEKLADDAKEEDDEEEEGAAAPAAGSSGVQTLFDRGYNVGVNRKLVLRRGSSFTVSAAYAEAAFAAAGGGLPANSDTSIASFSVAGVPQDSEPSKIKVFLGTDVSGIVKVKQAVLLEPVPEEAAADAEENGDAMDVEGKEGDDAAKAGGEEKPTKKRKFRRRELPVTTAAPGLTDAALMAAVELEAQMAHRDEELKLKDKIRNDLETYIYAKRDAIIDDLKDFITSEEKEVFGKALTDMEDWLYSDEGYEGTKDTFLGKLNALKAYGDPVEARVYEANYREAAADELKVLADSYVSVANSSDAKYAHLSDEDKGTLRGDATAAQTWLYDMLAKQASLGLDEDPVVTVAQLRERAQALRKVCQPIATKPKPAPKPEPAPADDKKEGGAEADAAGEANMEGADASEGKDDGKAEDDGMDVEQK